MRKRHWISSVLLLAALLGTSALLIAWKHRSNEVTAAQRQNQPEPSESVTVAVAAQREHRRASTSIGTVLALQSVALRNELAGTVHEVALVPGAVVEPGQVLVALDVAVEKAELAALEAQAALAAANLQRVQRLVRDRAAPVAEVERATAEHDVALAQIERVKAIIDRKTIRAPFRARVGLADVHPGQFLESGTFLTTLQGVDRAAHVDFAVAQQVAAELQPGDRVELFTRPDAPTLFGSIVAVDARVDPATRNASVRARVDHASRALAPGASVRVRVAQGPVQEAVAIPASALRRSPEGDQVFVVAPDANGQLRARVRRVQSGPSSGDEVLILSGLAAGERVAAAGSFKLRDAALVAIAEPKVLVAQNRR